MILDIPIRLSNPYHDEKGRFSETPGGHTFVSPNEGDLKFKSALAEMGSERHLQMLEDFAKIDKMAGLKATTRTALSAWKDGAENSSVSLYPKDVRWEDLKAAACMKGIISNQKAVLVFKDDAKGENFRHEIDVKGSTDLQKLHKSLLTAGIENHTLERVGKTLRIHIYDGDRSLLDKVKSITKEYHGKFRSFAGRGEFPGDWDDRKKGQAVQRGVLEGYSGSGRRERSLVERFYRQFGGRLGDRGRSAAGKDIKASLSSDVDEVLKEHSVKHRGHGRVECSCGAVIKQCRCARRIGDPREPPTLVLDAACKACKAKSTPAPKDALIGVFSKDAFSFSLNRESDMILDFPIELGGGNPNHDDRGRFASGDGGGTATKNAASHADVKWLKRITASAPKTLNELHIVAGRVAAKYHDFTKVSDKVMTKAAKFIKNATHNIMHGDAGGFSKAVIGGLLIAAAAELAGFENEAPKHLHIEDTAIEYVDTATMMHVASHQYEMAHYATLSLKASADVNKALEMGRKLWSQMKQECLEPKKKLSLADVSGESRDDHGRWTSGGSTDKAETHFEGKAAHPKGKDTQQQYQNKDGTWTPERKMLHDKIVKSYLDGITPVKRPVFQLMGGGTASGKSSIIDSGFVKLPKNMVKVDSDDIKKHLPEYQAGLKSKDPKAAAFVHEESSYLAKRIMAEAGKRHLNVMFDGTGNSNFDSVKKKVDTMRAMGHKIIATYVNVDTNTAVKRSMERAEKTGRYVPESVIRAIHKSVSEVVPKLLAAHVFDKAEVWDTAGKTPVKLASEDKKKLTVLNKKGWKNFLDKAKE